MRTSLLRDILDLFFPRTCAICGNVLAGGEEMICIKCLFRMPGTDTWEQPYDNEMAKLFCQSILAKRRFTPSFFSTGKSSNPSNTK